MLDGVTLKDVTTRQEKAALRLEETTGTVCTDFIKSLRDRLDTTDTVVSATSLADLKTGPTEYEEAKGNLHFKYKHKIISLTLYLLM